LDVVFFVSPVPHCAIGEANATDSRFAPECQPDFEPGVGIRVLPAVRNPPRKAIDQAIPHFGPFVTVFPLHLANEVERGSSFGLRANGVVVFEKLLPVRPVRGPFADIFQVIRSEGQRATPPGHQEDVFGGSQRENLRRQLIEFENDHAAGRLFDFAAQIASNLLRDNRFEPGLHHGIKRRRGGGFIWSSISGHGAAKSGAEVLQRLHSTERGDRAEVKFDETFK